MPGSKRCPRGCFCKKHKNKNKRKKTPVIPYTEWQYKNINMRSSFEVMAAIAMDQMGIKWMYEPKLFKFGRIWYVPDFYLPLEGKWVEVKGRMTKRGRIKIAAFKKAGYKLEIWRQKKLEKLLGMSCSTFVRKYRKGQI